MRSYKGFNTWMIVPSASGSRMGSVAYQWDAVALFRFWTLEKRFVD